MKLKARTFSAFTTKASSFTACLCTRARQLLCILALVISVQTSYGLELSSALLNFINERFGAQAKQRLLDWQDLANLHHQEAAPLSTSEKLQLVNDFFNRARFVSDQDHWGRVDYWATPVELLATNAGDCEDYSIAKYFTLKEMGFPVEQLKITYVKALELDQAHMVLAYYESPDAQPLILDNLINEIKPASQRTDLRPVYSFNTEGLWLNKFKGRLGKRLSGPEKIENWLDMMTRQNKFIKPKS